MICNIEYETECIPSDWQKGVICPLLKKGDKTLCDNHRGVMLFAQCVKICSRITEKRSRLCVENILYESQHGFRPRRSTNDLIFTFKMMLEKSWE